MSRHAGARGSGDHREGIFFALAHCIYTQHMEPRWLPLLSFAQTTSELVTAKESENGRALL